MHVSATSGQFSIYIVNLIPLEYFDVREIPPILKSFGEAMREPVSKAQG